MLCKWPYATTKESDRHLIENYKGEIMARVIQITQSDIDRLLANVDRDPEYGYNGGSGSCISEEKRRVYTDVHGFFNHQVRRWIGEITKDQ